VVASDVEGGRTGSLQIDLRRMLLGKHFLSQPLLRVALYRFESFNVVQTPPAFKFQTSRLSYRYLEL
jgi:hypothetical protein